eukprot:3336262-Rhodomonas_salina.1
MTSISPPESRLGGTHRDNRDHSDNLKAAIRVWFQVQVKAPVSATGPGRTGQGPSRSWSRGGSECIVLWLSLVCTCVGCSLSASGS